MKMSLSAYALSASVAAMSLCAHSDDGPAAAATVTANSPQTTAPLPPPDTSAAAQPSSTASPSQGQYANPETLQEVVVTANKKSESSRDVPETVSVITGGKLERIGATNFQDFASYVPGLTSSSAGTGENQVVLRGVTSGSQLASSVGVYLDETQLGSSSSYAFGNYSQDINVFDLSRLEVLSGPQGTLYGASTLGGLIKYVTMAPDLNAYGATAQGEISDTQNGGINHSERGVVNVPIIKGALAIRADGIAENDAGYVDNPNRNLKDVNAAKTRGGRVSLLGQITDDLSVRFGVLEQGIDRNGESNVDRNAQTHQPVQGRYDQSTLIGEPFKDRLLLYTGLMKWKLGWAELVSSSSWQNIGFTDVADITPAYGTVLLTGNLIPYEAYDHSSVKKFTQEVRLSSTPSKYFDWQVGAFYTVEHAIDYTDISGLVGGVGSFLGIPIPVGTTSLPLLDVDFYTKYRELAGFVDTTIHFTKQLDLTLGTRYSGNVQGYDQQLSGVLAATALLTGTNSPGSSRQNVATYLINPRYRLNADTILYARVASGYRPGGPNFVIPPPFPAAAPTFSADTLWNYELGEKATFLHRKASLDFDVFYIDWSKIQLLANVGGFNRIENAGKAQVRGAELTGSYKILRSLTIGGNFSYSHAKLADDEPLLGAASGSPLPLSPRFSAAMTADYSVTLNDWCQATAGISDRFIGPRPAGFDGSTVEPQYWLGSYNTVDLRFGLQTTYVNASLLLKNMFNQLGEVSANTSALEYNPNAPARVAITQPRTVAFILTFGL